MNVNVAMSICGITLMLGIGLIFHGKLSKKGQATKGRKYLDV